MPEFWSDRDELRSALDHWGRSLVERLRAGDSIVLSLPKRGPWLGGPPQIQTSPDPEGNKAQ